MGSRSRFKRDLLFFGIIRPFNNLPGDQYPSLRPETCRLVRGRRNSGKIPSGLLVGTDLYVCSQGEVALAGAVAHFVKLRYTVREPGSAR